MIICEKENLDNINNFLIGMEVKEFYHTQESRGQELKVPIKCMHENAWLGSGYYFWEDIDVAHWWGKTAKLKTGYYEIYISDINIEDVLDTVFDEEHYKTWLKIIERCAKNCAKATGVKPSLKEINNYFIEHEVFKKVNGILFQDLPANNDYVLVNNFFYKKRIQLVVYNKEIIISFKLHMRERI